MLLRLSRTYARLAAWILAVLMTILGIVFSTVRQTTAWVEQQGNPDVSSAQVVDLSQVGLVLLAAGLVSLMALLIAEGYAKPKIQDQNG